MAGAVETWRGMKARGKRLVGCFPLYPPLELIHSFGLTPVVLWGIDDGQRYYAKADEHLQNYACRIARVLTGLVIEEGPGLFDALFMYNACDTLRNLPEILSEGLACRGADSIPVFRMHVPAISLELKHARGYFEDRLGMLVGDLERFTGRPFSGESFMSSAVLHERARSLCREVERRCAAGLIPFAEAVRVIELGGRLDVSGHIEELERSVDSARTAGAARGGIRVMVSAIQAPPEELLEALDSAHLVVAVNDVASMARAYHVSTTPREDACSYLRDLYLHHHPCTTILPSQDARIAHILSRARASGARGFILFGEKFCEYE